MTDEPSTPDENPEATIRDIKIRAFVSGYLACLEDVQAVKTQEVICLMSARAGVYAGDNPDTDSAFIDAASGMAEGLFGPAYAEANEWQKAAWQSMCEEALRKASKQGDVHDRPA